MDDIDDENTTEIKINGNDPEMCYLIYQLKQIFSSLPASTICDLDFVIGQLRKKLFVLDPMMLQSLDCESKKNIKQNIDCTLDHTRKIVDDYLDKSFESIKHHIFRKFETNYFMHDGKEGVMH